MMNDLEITKLCAQAMGYSGFRYHGNNPGYECASVNEIPERYWPLRDDSQAMGLVKKFRLSLDGVDKSKKWFAGDWKTVSFAMDADLNRAICECVAKMTLAR